MIKNSNIRVGISTLYKKYIGEFNFTLSNIYGQFVFLLSGAVAARYIGPTDMGIINSVQLVFTYVSFLHLGVFNGLNRNLAFNIAQQKEYKINSLVNTSYSVAYITSLIGTGVGIVVLLIFVCQFRPFIYLLSAITLTLTLALNPYVLHFDTTYRSSQHFKKLARISFIENTILLIAGFAPMIVGFFGKLLSLTLKFIVKFFFRRRYQPYPRTGKGDLDTFKELVGVGFPLLITSYIYMVFVATDQSIIIHFLGPTELGLYSISTMILSSMMLFPTSLTLVLNPRAAYKYGSAKNNKMLGPFFVKALILNIVLLAPMTLLIYFLVEPVVYNFFPRYTEGILAAKISVFTSFSYVAMGPSVIIGVTRRNSFVIFLYIFAIIAMWISAIVVPSDSLNIETISMIRLIVSFTVSLAIIIYCFFIIHKLEFKP